MSLMQQLQQMSGQQMNLNNLTQMLQKMQQGGMSPQQQLENAATWTTTAINSKIS